MKKKFLLIPCAAILCAAVINALFITTAHVSSRSMEPTLSSGSIVTCDKNAYRNDTPMTGDVILFSNPEVSDALLVKRIIALPGQRFAITEGRVYINGNLLEEPYVNCFSNETTEEVTVPEDSYVVLGDNRPESNDSRSWSDPFITKEQIKAKVNLSWFPKFKIMDTE